MTDEPIEPLAYLSGVTVVDIGDYRVSRGMTRRPASSCAHLHMSYDPHERRIWCSDCEKDVEPFDAFLSMVQHINEQNRKNNARAARLTEAEAFQVRSLAAKEIDKAWRSRTMVPACPSCGNGLFPEDFKNGAYASLGREYATARRNKAKASPPTPPTVNSNGGGK